MPGDRVGRTEWRILAGARNALTQDVSISRELSAGFEYAGIELKVRGLHTRVVCKTLASLGKSFTPESRIEMLDESS